MIDRLPLDLYGMLNTYLSTIDLKELAQTTPSLRLVLPNYSWKNLYVVPRNAMKYEPYLNYPDYRVVDEICFTQSEKYKWFAASAVRNLKFSQW